MYIHANKALIHIKYLTTVTLSQLGVELDGRALAGTKPCVQYQVTERAATLQILQDEQQVTSAGSAFATAPREIRKMHAAMSSLGLMTQWAFGIRNQPRN